MARRSQAISKAMISWPLPSTQLMLVLGGPVRISSRSTLPRVSSQIWAHLAQRPPAWRPWLLHRFPNPLGRHWSLAFVVWPWSCTAKSHEPSSGTTGADSPRRPARGAAITDSTLAFQFRAKPTGTQSQIISCNVPSFGEGLNDTAPSFNATHASGLSNSVGAVVGDARNARLKILAPDDLIRR